MIKGNIGSDKIGEILDRLATDDAFREQLLGDPKSALAPYGLEVDESRVPAVRTLPSKERIASARDEMKAQLGGNLGLVIFLLR
jgi:putative modified peptide